MEEAARRGEVADDVVEQDEPLPAPEDERDIDFPGEDVEPVSELEA